MYDHFLRLKGCRDTATCFGNGAVWATLAVLGPAVRYNNILQVNEYQLILENEGYEFKIQLRRYIAELSHEILWVMLAQLNCCF